METKREGHMDREGLFTYHPLSDKERKNAIILELIRKKGPISRTDLSRITDINIVSISNYIKEYVKENLIVEKGFDESSGGRRPELVELNREGVYVLGVDIGFDRIAATITDLEIKVKDKINIPNLNLKLDEIAAKATNSIQELIKSSKIEAKNIKAVGMGISDNALLGARSQIEKNIGITTFIGSDAACAAFGEKTLNKAADVADLLYMYSDVGCGIIMRGDIYFGAGGCAGEMQISNSHISKEEEAILLRDAKYLRPWSTYFGLVNSAKREIGRGIGTKMVAIAKGDVKNVTKEVVIEAARQNDEIALYIIQNAAMNLGLRIAYLVNLFNPEVVVVGGGIEKAGLIIMEPIIDKVKKFAFSEQANIVRVIPSSLGEDAVSLGAASLAAREIFLRA